MLDADGDSAKSLPKTDVEPEFPKRLLLMKRMGQFGDDGPILDHFGLAFVAAQEGGEIIVKPRFAQPQTDHKTLLAAQRWERGHLSGPDSL